MYSYILEIWGYEISDISWNSGASGEGVTTWRLSLIRIDYVEDFASSSSWKTSSKRVEAENFE